ncbi:MAG: DNA topoisomerase VI subunit B [Proteobacteria bacterium]|nr:DNA topoisomerase VI subunit B [Pseudomonadota bacterium]
MAVASKITSSSTAEYFSKNLQQVGFSSGTKAVLTTLKESVDNSLDACEDAQILPEVTIEIEKLGVGSQKNMDQIRILVRDNGPGIPTEDLSRVYGEYLASSKFGRGRCSRGQQGIGISAATTWAQLTSAQGVKVITKTKAMRQAIQGIVEVDIKKNQGVLKDKKSIDWDRPHGTSVEFILDGRLQMQGEGGVLTYLTATSLVNPHLTLNYKINDEALVKLDRVTKIPVDIPEAVAPHPHTLKLGEFLSHGTLFGKSSLETFLKKGFSRINDPVIDQLKKNGLGKGLLDKSISSISDKDLKSVYEVIQKTELMPPNTRSVLSIGEEGLADSIKRLGEIDFFSVVSRKPRICDFKPVVVEVAIARFLKNAGEADDPVTVLRFANRVPLQFDKSSCAIVKALESVNWRAYGLAQPKNSLPIGPYVVAVSVVSPFIKFKNASKETIDGSDELVEELRLALIQAGQRLSRYIKREQKEFDLEKKKQHIEQFGPILIECLGRITKAPQSRLEKAKLGMLKILGRDADKAEGDLETAVQKQSKLDERMKKSSEADDENNDKNNDDSNEEANA